MTMGHAPDQAILRSTSTLAAESTGEPAREDADGEQW